MQDFYTPGLCGLSLQTFALGVRDTAFIDPADPPLGQSNHLCTYLLMPVLLVVEISGWRWISCREYVNPLTVVVIGSKKERVRCNTG